ncbi:MAG: hypothetical protein ACRD0Q_10500 [Acidimicrobiales bacterium]
MIVALFAFIGVLVGSLTSIALEVWRSSSDRKARRADALRVASAAFTSSLTRIERIAPQLVLQEARKDELIDQLRGLQVQAAAEYEVLRLLLRSLQTQEAGLKTLRFAWTLWQDAIKGVHPRHPESKWDLYQHQLQTFLVGVRSELGLPNPEAVFVEPAEWRSWLYD